MGKKVGFFQSIKNRDPAARSAFEIFLFYPGVHALIWFRVSHFFYKIHLRFLATWLCYLCRFFTGIEIHPAATIGKNLFIDHGNGVVIGETSVIGDNCTIYQNATLGGTGKEHNKRHPTLKDNVVVGAGARILGNITIGNNVKVGANSVVLKDVPDNCTVVGVGRVIVREPQSDATNEQPQNNDSQNTASVCCDGCKGCDGCCQRKED